MMEVRAKYDANGYPYATFLPEAYDPEMHGDEADWDVSDRASVNAKARANVPEHAGPPFEHPGQG